METPYGVLVEMASSVERNISDELEALLECPICMEPLKEPRSLPCFHNFCKICLTNYVAGLRGENIEQFPCPTCRSQFTLKSNENVEGMPGNYFIRNMLEVMSIQQQAKASKCQCCGAAAVSRCIDCEMFMCQNCSNYHGKFPSNKKHTVLSLSELNDPEGEAKIKSKLYCKKHEDKTLKFYCETCKELSCTHCMVLTHNKQNHYCVSVEEIAQRQREILQSSCKTLDENLSEGREALDDIAGVMKLLEENVSTAKEKIEEHFQNFLKYVAEKLNEGKKKLFKEVDDIYEKIQTVLKKQHDDRKQYVDKIQGSISLPQNLLKKGSIEEILSFQKVIDENIEKLRNERPENLYAVNDKDIEYVPEVIENINVDDLVKKLGSIRMTRTLEEKRVDGRIARYERCLRLKPGYDVDQSLLGSLADLYQTKACTEGKDDKVAYQRWMDKAQGCFQKLLDKNLKMEPFVEAVYASFLYQTKRLDEAISHFEQLIGREIDNKTITHSGVDKPFSGVYLAREIEARGTVSLPLKIFVYYQMVLVYLECGKVKKARKSALQMEEYVKNFTSRRDYSLIHSFLAYTYKEIGNGSKASEIFQAVLNREPDNEPVKLALKECQTLEQTTQSNN